MSQNDNGKMLELAKQLHDEGRGDEAEMLVKAATALGHKAHVFNPQDARRGFAPAGSGGARPRLLDHNGAVLPPSYRSQIIKAAGAANVKDELQPQATQIRLSQTLAALGAYNGIIDPAQYTLATFAILKIAARLPLVQAIINTRVNQAMEAPWRIRQKNLRAPLTPGARKHIEMMTELTNHGGFVRQPDIGGRKGALRVHPVTGEPGVWDGNGFERALPFPQFKACMVRDSLTMGFAAFRTEPGADEEAYPVSFFRPVASEMIRRVLAPREGYPGYSSQFTPPTENVAYIEIDPSSMGRDNTGLVIREYPWSRMGTIERYPQVNALGLAYPYCEVEMCLEKLATLVNIDRFGAENYDSNHIPLGIVSIIGATLGEEAFYELQAQLAKGGGMGAFYNLLYMHFLGDQAGAGVNFTPFRSQTGIGAELQFALQFKGDIRDDVLGVFQMNPEELGQRANDQNGPKLSENGPDASIAHSKSKGFKPLMKALDSGFNQAVIERFDPDFELVHEHLDGENQEEDAKVFGLWMGTGRTYNQVCDQRDEPRIMHPVEPTIWNQFERQLKKKMGEEWEEGTASPEEFREEVDRLYEEQCKKEGLPCIWSSAYDAPAGNAQGMLQVFMGEQAQNTAYRQQKQQAQQQQAQAQQAAQQQQQMAPQDPNAMQQGGAPVAAPDPNQPVGPPPEAGQAPPSGDAPNPDTGADTGPDNQANTAGEPTGENPLPEADDEPQNGGQSGGQKSRLFGFQK